MNSGIYTITNQLDNKLYIGLAVDIEKRLKEHRNDLIRGDHDNEKLQHAWNKYGADNFVFETLEECAEEYLYSMEHYWCLLTKSHDRRYGYNIRPTHPYGTPRLSEETKRKLSIAHSGKPKTSEHIEKMRKTKTGMKMSTEVRNAHVKRRRKDSGKAVVMLDMNGKFVKGFEVQSDAVRELNLSHCQISSIVTGRTKSAGGYMFVDKLEYDTTAVYRYERDVHRKEVHVYNLINSNYQKFNSYTDATITLQIYKGGIAALIDKKWLTNGLYFSTKEMTDEEIQKLKMLYKPIEMYRDGKLIDRFRDCKQAARSIDATYDVIWLAVKGKKESAHGYKWKKYEYNKES